MIVAMGMKLRENLFKRVYRLFLSKRGYEIEKTGGRIIKLEEEIMQKFYKFFFGKNGNTKIKDKNDLKFIRMNGDRAILSGSTISFYNNMFGGRDQEEKWIEINLSDLKDIIPVPRAKNKKM